MRQAHNCPNFLPEEFLGCGTGKGKEMEPNSHPELSSKGWNSGKVKVTSVQRAEYQQGEHSTERSAEVPSNIRLSMDQLMLVRKLSEGKE